MIATAWDAHQAGVSLEEIVAALRAYCDVQPGEAAVELLIGHNGTGHWLTREPVLRLVDWAAADEDGPAMALPDWRAIREWVEDVAEGQPDTPSEWAVLRVAVSIAIGPLAEAAWSCDQSNRRLVADAVMAALGFGTFRSYALGDHRDDHAAEGRVMSRSEESTPIFEQVAEVLADRPELNDDVAQGLAVLFDVALPTLTESVQRCPTLANGDGEEADDAR